MLRLHNDYQLRALSYPSDMPGIERLWTRTFESTWPIAGEQLGEMLARQNRTNPGWCDVVVHHEPIGIIAYQQRQHSPTEGSLVLVLIDPEYQRRKIGTVLVLTALDRLRKEGVVSVELGAWADPQFWHGLPLDCTVAREFFSVLGWRYNEENADLVVDLVNYVAPRSLFDKVTASGTSFRTAKDEDQDRILEFVRNEYEGFAPYYAEELRHNGAGQIHLAETESRIDAAIISSKPPHCPGAHWQRLLGRQMCAMGALLVRGETRRRGIGLGLCAYTLEELKREGFQSCYLEWATLVHMYTQLGARVWRRYVQGKIVL